MQTTSKHKVLRLAAGSILAACSVFGTAGFAFANGDDKDPKPPPSLPNLPTDPGEGLPVPVPGGGG